MLKIKKFSDFTDFLDSGLKNMPQTFVFKASGASGENDVNFMIFLIFLWKKSFMMMKNEKIRKNMKIMFRVKVLHLAGTGKLKKSRIPGKLWFSWKIAKFHKIPGILWNLTKNQEKTPEAGNVAVAQGIY